MDKSPVASDYTKSQATDEAVRIIIPTTKLHNDDIDGPTVSSMRYIADQVMITVLCHIELLLPGSPDLGQWHSSESPQSMAAFSVTGTESNVHLAREMIAQSQRCRRQRIEFINRIDSPDAIAIARQLEDGWQGVPTPHPDQEEIYGDPVYIESARYKRCQERDEQSGLEVDTFFIPVRAVGKVIGCSGRRRLETFLSTGVIVDISGWIGQESGQIEVFLTGKNRADLQRVKHTILDDAKQNISYKEDIPAETRCIDWLLTNCWIKLQRIVYQQGTSVEVDSETIKVFGENRGHVSATVKQVTELMFEFHWATLWIPVLSQDQLSSRLEAAAQRTGAEVVCTSQFSGYMVDFYGHESQINQAMMEFENVGSMQLKYHLTQSEEIREFVSGKKDGKLIKIMKDTGVSLCLQPSQTMLGKNIDIELVGHDPRAIYTALKMLRGEFPSELSFFLSEAHHKRLIGHGGKTIQKVMKKFAVYIKFLSAEEAIDHVGAEILCDLPKCITSRLDNVIIRTPAKNYDALEATRRAIFDMAEECDNCLSEKVLRLQRHVLLRLDKDQRDQVAAFIKLYAESLDFSAPDLEFQGKSMSIISEQTDEIFSIKVSGYPSALDSFFTTLTTPNPEGVKTLFQSLLYAPMSVVRSPVMGPVALPLSPVISTPSSEKSTSSGKSWTSRSPDLFRQFSLAVLHVRPESAVLSTMPTPTLSSDSEVPVNEMLSTALEQGYSKLFEPTIGSQRKKSPLLGMDFYASSLIATSPTSGKTDTKDLFRLVQQYLSDFSQLLGLGCHLPRALPPTLLSNARLVGPARILKPERSIEATNTTVF